jgi:hypothetical protein
MEDFVEPIKTCIGSMKTYCHVLGDLDMGFGLVTGFTGLLKHVTTINYSTTTNPHSTIHYSTH